MKSPFESVFYFCLLLSLDKEEEWTAEPIHHFFGDAKKKAQAVIDKGECWPWRDPARVHALKLLGMYYMYILHDKVVTL